jgi:hypothetical protein
VALINNQPRVCGGFQDHVYSSTLVGPDGIFVPTHVYRCGSNWHLGTFSFPGRDTPGEPNFFCPPPIGTIAGLVTADCPVAGAGLEGVLISIFESGDFVNSTKTGPLGDYEFANLDPGSYLVSVSAPLSYSAVDDEVTRDLEGGETEIVDFSLLCADIASNPRTIGFWKHNVGIATSGRETGYQVDGETLCGYLDEISDHFNSNAVNEVVVYEPPMSGECIDKLGEAKTLLNLKGSVTMEARAKQQLLALLFNVAAGFISLTEVISDDGANVSQAITYCDNLIDNPLGDHELAKTIADEINNGRMVAAGLIPLGTPFIAYSPYAIHSFYVSPNPGGTGQRVFSFIAEATIAVKLEIYSAAGRRVATPYDGAVSVGPQKIVWNGRSDQGMELGSGIYFARLTTPGSNQTIKVLQIAR